jgi:hypothetical protein
MEVAITEIVLYIYHQFHAVVPREPETGMFAYFLGNGLLKADKIVVVLTVDDCALFSGDFHNISFLSFGAFSVPSPTIIHIFAEKAIVKFGRKFAKFYIAIS